MGHDSSSQRTESGVCTFFFAVHLLTFRSITKKSDEVSKRASRHSFRGQPTEIKNQNADNVFRTLVSMTRDILADFHSLRFAEFFWNPLDLLERKTPQVSTLFLLSFLPPLCCFPFDFFPFYFIFFCSLLPSLLFLFHFSRSFFCSFNYILASSSVQTYFIHSFWDPNINDWNNKISNFKSCAWSRYGTFTRNFSRMVLSKLFIFNVSRRIVLEEKGWVKVDLLSFIGVCYYLLNHTWLE